MRMYSVVASLIVLTVACTGGRRTFVQPPPVPRDPLLDAIIKHDVSAVVAAEKAGDRRVVPWLVAQLSFGGPSDEFTVAAKRAIVALADREQLQHVWCTAADERDYPHTNDRGLGVIGGWFDIRALQEMLSPERDRRWERARRREPLTDIAYISPSFRALMKLARLFPESPAGIFWRNYTFGQTNWVAQLRDWIRARQPELEKLPPTGEGVDFSEKACKDGKPVKP